MKRYIYCLILFPIFIFGNPGIGDKRNASFNDLETLVNYPDYSVILERTDFVSTNGGASGSLSVTNNALSVSFSGGWNQSVIKTGVIKVLTISPSLPDLELGSILTSSTGTSTGYNVKIENNSLVIYSTGTTLPLTTTAYFNAQQDLNEGSAIVIPKDDANNWIHGVSYDTKGNVIGQSRSYFDDLGKSDVSLSKDYVTNKIWGSETTYDNYGRPDKTSFIAPSPLNTFDKTNFLKSNTQVVADPYPSILPINNITASGAYKASQSITATGTISPGLNVSLTAPIITLNNFSATATSGSSLIITAAILPDNSLVTSLANYYSDNNTDEPYQATATQPFAQTNYDVLNPGNIINVVGGNKINGEWKTGYSYTMPAAQEMYYAYGTDHLDNDRDIEPYISKREYPEYDNMGLSAYWIKIIYSESDVKRIESIPPGGYHTLMQMGARPYPIKANYPLERGKLYKMLISGETQIIQIFNEISFRKADQISDLTDPNNPLKIVAGSWDTYSEIKTLDEVITIFNNPNNTIFNFKSFKTISVDGNGEENVSFRDTDGKVLASAKSGGSRQYPVKSLIGPQGFVDIHLPVGCEGTLVFIGNISLYNVYNLKTGILLTTAEKANMPPGVYRIELITKSSSSLGLTYYNDNSDAINNIFPADGGVTYAVNYYDYSIHVYNKTGQLIKSIQPNSLPVSTRFEKVPANMISAIRTNLATTYKYNALNQLIEISNPDEGISKFTYRNDGQIRYSQNALQADTKVSYTNYDSLNRPIESGIITGGTGLWAIASSNSDATLLIPGTRSEQLFTIYDYPENNATSVTLPTAPINLTLSGVLATAGINTANYTQNNLSGNVAVTYTKPGSTVSAITWYSYDLYGRTEWIVQYNEGIGAKTIHYEYDYKGNIKKVLFQKDKATELFIHQYAYNTNNVLTKVETSTDNINFVTHAEYSYYKTGELKRVNIAQGTQGLDYVYTLGGQLKSINHPSLEAAKDPGGDANDVFGLTLDYYNGDYLRTGRNIVSSPSAGSDYNGNIKAARWSNKGVAGDHSGSTANQKGYLYNYDRNNWLTSANFGNVNSTSAVINPTSSFAEKGISYDSNGNITSLQRTNDTGAYIDDLEYYYDYDGKYGDLNYKKNQLLSVTDLVTSSDPTDIKNQSPFNFKYDVIGQLKQNVSENLFYFYNTQGLVTEIKKGSNTIVKFFYNERGQRIKKESYNTTAFVLQSTSFYQLDLSGKTMAIYNMPSGGAITQVELPIYGLDRLGIYKKTSGIASYEIKDHLGNVRAIIEKESGSPVIKSFADYYPFGELLPNRNSLNYRYAFQGQELDKETGMEAFQLRLWDGRLGRWLSPDPMGQYSSPYLGMGNNPVSRIDPDGGLDIEPSRKAYYEGESYFDNSDGTYYLGKNDGSWLEASQLGSVYITPTANGWYLNQFESHRTYDSFNWSQISTGYNYKNGNLEVGFNARTFNLDLYGSKSSTAFIIGGSVAALQGSISGQYENDIIKAAASADAKFLSADGEIAIGLFNGQQGRKGFYAGASGGAAYVKSDVEGSLTFLGVHIMATAGGAAGTAEGGVRVGAYKDLNNDTYNFEFYQRLGFLLGERAGFKITF